MDILAKDFNNRQELEQKIASLIGLTTIDKPTYLIKGARQELKKLQLSEKSIFWGIRCKASDPLSPLKLIKTDRGKIHKSKIETISISNSKEI